MVLVAEGYGLVGALALACDPGRTLQIVQRHAERNDD
jgi:hypothetical protein